MTQKLGWMVAFVLFVGLVFAGSRQTGMQHKMPRMEYVVESRLGFDETIEELKKASEAEKYGVQGLHEVSKILESKGFPRERLSVLEVCNAKMASETLKNDVLAGLMMPCPIMVYMQGDKVMVATFDTKSMATMYEGSSMASIGASVDAALKKIISSVKK